MYESGPLGSGTNEQQSPQVVHDALSSSASTTASEASSAANTASPPTGAAEAMDTTESAAAMRPPPEKRDHAALREHQIPRGMQHTFSSTMDTASTTNIPTRTTSSTTAAVYKTATGAQRGWVVDVAPEKKDHRALRAYQKQMEMLEEAKRKQAGALSTANTASAPKNAAEATGKAATGWVIDVPPSKKDHAALREYQRQLEMVEEAKAKRRQKEEARRGGKGRL